MIGPGEAVRLLVMQAAGSVVAEDGEEAVDAADLTAALTLMPLVRAEVDQLEASLLMMARGRGMTWQELAFGLGLGSAQAARQRYERLTRRLSLSFKTSGGVTGLPNQSGSGNRIALRPPVPGCQPAAGEGEQAPAGEITSIGRRLLTLSCARLTGKGRTGARGSPAVRHDPPAERRDL